MSNEPDLEERKYLWGKRHEALYKAELSALYHQKRERFFELCDKVGKAISLIGGSATLWKLDSPSVIVAAGLIITISSSFSLVLSFSDRSRKHAELARNFRQVITEIIGKGERDFSEEDINAWKEKLCTLEVSEPPTLSALTVLCQNELAIAQGHKEKVHPLKWWQRLFLHIFDIPQAA